MRFHQIKIGFLAALFAVANMTSLMADSYFCNDSYSCCEQQCCEQPCCWQGLYINGQIGGVWAKHHNTFKNANFFNTDGPIVLGSRFNIKDEGFIGGGGLGYNYQCGDWVIGVEGGAFGTDLKKHRNSPFFPDTDRFSAKVEWMANAKLRVGYAFNCFLPFVYGGWAGGDVKLRLTDTLLGVSTSSSKWINGWTVGAGVDYKFNDCISIGVAYDYVELEHTKTYSCVDCGTGIGFGAPRVKNRLEIQTLVFRVNYHLNFF
jgi:outer membrane immunogenic protein